jgi:hypothetical protein
MPTCQHYFHIRLHVFTHKALAEKSWHCNLYIGFGKGDYYNSLEGRRPHGRHGCRWGDNIKMDLKGTGGGWTGFIRLRKGPMTGCYECDNEPSALMKYRELLA